MLHLERQRSWITSSLLVRPLSWTTLAAVAPRAVPRPACSQLIRVEVQSIESIVNSDRRPLSINSIIVKSPRYQRQGSADFSQVSKVSIQAPCCFPPCVVCWQEEQQRVTPPTDARDVRMRPAIGPLTSVARAYSRLRSPSLPASHAGALAERVS